MIEFTLGPWHWEFSCVYGNRIALANSSAQDVMIVTSDLDDHPLIEISEPNAHLIARAPSMLALLEKALPLIQKEAHRRDSALIEDGRSYWSEMRELATEISQEIDRARGKEVKDV